MVAAAAAAVTRPYVRARVCVYVCARCPCGACAGSLPPQSRSPPLGSGTLRLLGAACAASQSPAGCYRRPPPQPPPPPPPPPSSPSPPHPSRARPPCLTTRKRSAPGRSGGGSSSQPDSGGAAAHARREGRHPDVAMRDLPRSAAERGADGAAERCERVESGTSVSAGTRKDADTVLRSRLLALPGRVRAQQQLPGVAPRWRTGVRVVLPIFRFAFSIRVHFSVICSVVP